MAKRGATGNKPGEGAGAHARKSPANSRRMGLANSPEVVRVYDPDREAMRAALRVVLGLPKRPSFGQEVPA